MTGLLTHIPADIIQKLIIDMGAANPVDSEDWPIFSSVMPETPDECLRVRDTLGQYNGREMVEGEVQEYYGLQIIVRSPSPTNGYPKLKTIMQRLAKEVNNREVELESSLYLVEAIIRPGPVFRMGEEQTSRRTLHSVNFLASIVSLELGTGTYED